jgi:16S rRNA U1498 N3-methylase RsmE
VATALEKIVMTVNGRKDVEIVVEERSGQRLKKQKEELAFRRVQGFTINSASQSGRAISPAWPAPPHMSF